jgi:hypothetical protein
MACVWIAMPRSKSTRAPFPKLPSYTPVGPVLTGSSGMAKAGGQVNSAVGNLWHPLCARARRCGSGMHTCIVDRMIC